MNPETDRASIEAHNIREHKERLKERLHYIQLEFADGQMKGPSPKEKFSDIIWSMTPLGKEITDRLRQKLRKESPEKEISGERLENEITLRHAKIDEIYQLHLPDWMEQIMALIHESGFALEVVPEELKEKAGLLHYNDATADPKEFSKFGIRAIDRCLEVHFQAMYTRPEEQFSVKHLRDSFSDLAQIIATQQPDVRGVLMQSWLIGRLNNMGLSKLFGWHIISNSPSLDHESTWWQLIDSKGKIKSKEIEFLKKEGRLPYEDAYGFIPVRELMEMFYPRTEKPQIITLKRLAPEFIESVKRIDAISEAVKNAWHDGNGQEINNILNEEKLKPLMESEIGDDIRNFFDNLKLDKYSSYSAMLEAERPGFVEIRDRIRNYVMEHWYQNEGIEIPPTKDSR